MVYKLNILKRRYWKNLKNPLIYNKPISNQLVINLIWSIGNLLITGKFNRTPISHQSVIWPVDNRFGIYTWLMTYWKNQSSIGIQSVTNQSHDRLMTDLTPFDLCYLRLRSVQFGTVFAKTDTELNWSVLVLVIIETDQFW